MLEIGPMTQLYFGSSSVCYSRENDLEPVPALIPFCVNNLLFSLSFSSAARQSSIIDAFSSHCHSFTSTLPMQTFGWLDDDECSHWNENRPWCIHTAQQCSDEEWEFRWTVVGWFPENIFTENFSLLALVCYSGYWSQVCHHRGTIICEIKY